MLTTAQASSGPSVGDVKQKMGTTWVERDFENITIEEADFPLYMDDFLQTGEDGAMNVEFVDGTKITVAPNSELVIDEFTFDTEVVPIQVALAIAINVGTFTYESGSISKLGGDVAMITPSAIITVQGTAFSGTVDPNGKTTITLLPDSDGNVGRVTVLNQAGATTITQAFSSVTVLSDSLMPSPPSPLDTNERNQLFDLETNEEVIEEAFDNQVDRRQATQKLENLNEETETETDNELVKDEKDATELVKDDHVDEGAKEIEQIEEKEDKGLATDEAEDLKIIETQKEVKVELVAEEPEELVENKIEAVEIIEQDFEVEVTDEVASNLEESLMNEKATVDTDANFDTKEPELYDDSTDIIDNVMVDDFNTTNTVETKSVTEDIIVDDSVNTEVDTSYYDQWDDDAYDEDWGWVDENDQVTVWDSTGETKMDYEDSKKMWSEMDQAYYDAIGCENNCDWDSIDWNEVDWDSVDWDALQEKQDATMASYGLETDWDNYLEDWEMEDSTDLDVTDDVFNEIDKLEGDVTDDLDVWYDDPEVFDEAENTGDEEFKEAQNDYYSGEGPYLITGKEDWCDPVWCTQQYIDESNEYAQMDWDMNTKYDSWTKESKKLFKKLILNPDWYGDTKDAPKPWQISEIKDIYISEWGWSEWDVFWDAFYEWQEQGSYDNWESEYEELSLEDEYSFEVDEIDEWEIEYLAGLTTEPDCIYMGYYWDKKNQSCGTEWVDNTGIDIKVTASGETINYETGVITQTVTTVTNGVSSSVTQTGRYSTYGNSADLEIHTGDNGYKRMDRTYTNHKVYLTTNTITNFDVMIIQEEETQATTAGTAGSRATITIIQTK